MYARAKKYVPFKHTTSPSIALNDAQTPYAMSLNKVMLIGNVGKDPVIRYIEGGICTASLTLATSTPGYTLPNGTTVPDRTDWHIVLLWRTLAAAEEVPMKAETDILSIMIKRTKVWIKK